MLDSVIIIGVDPGKTTGLAWYSDGKFNSGDYSSLNACDVIHNLLNNYHRSKIIAVERYNITRQTIRFTRQYDALEIIGTCRWFSHRFAAEFILQDASAAQYSGNVLLLKQLQWWVSGKDHCNKAASQVVLACQRAFPNHIQDKLNLM